MDTQRSDLIRDAEIKHLREYAEHCGLTKGQANRLLSGWGLRKNSHPWDVEEYVQKWNSLLGWMADEYDCHGNKYRRCCTFEEAHAEFGISRPAFDAMLKADGATETTVYIGKSNGREFELYLDHVDGEYAFFDVGGYETWYGFGTDFAEALKLIEAYYADQE